MVYEDDVIAGTMGGVLTQTILQHSNQSDKILFDSNKSHNILLNNSQSQTIFFNRATW